MTTKFFEEFVLQSEGAFPELKLNSATYLREKHELTVRFIISAFLIRSFDEKKQAQVLEVLKKVLPGVNVTVQYIRTYADESVVRNKVLEYFNRYNQMIFRRLKEDNLSVTVDDNDILVKINFETPVYMLLLADNTTEKLTDYLDCNFNQEISVSILENVVDPSEYKDEIRPVETVYNEGGARLIKVNIGEKVYARGKIAGINQLPNYIADVKNPAENVILCGKISNIQQKDYANKKYEEGNPKSGPQRLPLFRFMLDDTTAKMDSVCFPKVEDAVKIADLTERETVACIGKVSFSQYSGALSYAVDAIFKCSIDFDSIKLTSVKPVPEHYTTVFPTAYSEVRQDNMFEDNSETPEYLKNKTFVILDFEATDKVITTAEPIELAAVKLVNGKPTEVFQTFVKPSLQISEEITALTTITNEMVANAPSFDEVVPDFYKFTRNAVLVGHNISGYDYPLLAKFAEKYGYNFNNDMDDTLLMAREYFKSEMTKFDLVTISKRLNISHENAHRAIADVYATVDLLREIAKRM